MSLVLSFVLAFLFLSPTASATQNHKPSEVPQSHRLPKANRSGAPSIVACSYEHWEVGSPGKTLPQIEAYIKDYVYIMVKRSPGDTKGNIVLLCSKVGKHLGWEPARCKDLEAALYRNNHAERINIMYKDNKGCGEKLSPRERRLRKMIGVTFEKKKS